MRNLVVCCDGTWNTPNQQHDGVATPTNVYRLYNAVEPQNPDGVEQLTYYHPGVGAEGNWLGRLIAGGFGLGLTNNIKSAYKWLGQTYRPADRIYLFGFSRGAYTARSLAGMIAHSGLLRLDPDDPQVWDQVEQAMRAYRSRTARAAWVGQLSFHGAGDPPAVPIHCVGVFDTVGALGVPDDLALLNLIDHFTNLTFHDTQISDQILHARHAVAIDERREPFSPTLWTGPGADRASVQQVWFPGVHADVGGGYPETGLSDTALTWMFEETTALGLGFHPGMVAQSAPDPCGVLHDSGRGAMRGLRTCPRSLPDLSVPSPSIHRSVRQRQEDPPIAQGRYRPTLHLQIGELRELDVFAGQTWNGTDLYLDTGQEYEFTARGEWVDLHDQSGPDGLEAGRAQAGEVGRFLGTLLGLVERWWKRLTGNQAADFRFTRRHEDMPWFCLVGVVANGQAGAAGVPVAHESFRIGRGPRRVRVVRGGYFHAYANDAWNRYGNNRGSVRLTVSRLA